jgi:hypothetical protein
MSEIDMDIPKNFLVIMERKNGTQLCKHFDNEPTALDLNTMALEAGWETGDIFPNFVQYEWTGAGGGIQSGRVGDKWP